jgi:muramidase (phage lysozyme)
MANEQGNTVSPFPGRVKYVLLDDSDKEKFDKYGGWKGIGTIEFNSFIDNDYLINGQELSARPMNMQLSQYPIKNEIVLIIKLITYNAQTDIGGFDSQYYYTSILNTWNSTEHNVTPGKGTDINTALGLFKEQGYSKLIKNPGDVFIESRTKASVKLGSSIKNFNSVFKGDDRSPITVITSNRDIAAGDKDSKFENINRDGSSLYFLKGHDVGLLVGSANFKSFSTDIPQEDRSKIIIPKSPVATVPDFETEKTPVIEKKEPEKKKPVTGNTIPTSSKLTPKKLSNFGKVKDSVPDYIKPVLDMISYSEGTAGYSQEYDVIAGFSLIDNWAPNYKLGHPNKAVRIGSITTTAAGRYQFLYSTWASIYGSKAFSETNQDIAAYDTIKGKVADSVLKKAYEEAKAGKTYENNPYFQSILGNGTYLPNTTKKFKWANTSGIWTVWSSLPSNRGSYAYGNVEYGSQKSNKRPEYYYDVYLYAVSKY